MKRKTKIGDKKKPFDIKFDILRAVINCGWDVVRIQTISKLIHSNWLTTEKFVYELVHDGLLKQIFIQDKCEGVSINSNAVLLLKALLEKPEVDKIKNLMSENGELVT